MAASSSKKLLLFVLFFACSLVVQGTENQVICEKLPNHLCSYAVSSTGKRCALQNEGCKTSEIQSDKLAGYIETDQCVNSCGITRQSVGMSGDAFLSPDFTSHLCSPSCFQNCPNIVDYYSALAAGEGLSVPVICEKVTANANGAMSPTPNPIVGDASNNAAAATARRAALDGLFTDSAAPGPAGAPVYL